MAFQFNTEGLEYGNDDRSNDTCGKSTVVKRKPFMGIVKMGAQRRHGKTNQSAYKKTEQETDWQREISQLGRLGNDRR